METHQKISLDKLLIKHRAISPAQLKKARLIQKNKTDKLEKILLEQGYITEDKLLPILAIQLQVKWIDLKRYPFKPDIVQLIPETDTRRFRAIALNRTNDFILVGMVDPTDIFAFDELTKILKQPIHLALVRENDFLRTIDGIYRRTDEITHFAKKLLEELSSNDLKRLTDKDINEAPVVKLVQSLFEDALQMRASDIHIEPDEKVLRIRLRIDNQLHEQIIPEISIMSALVSRLKLMAGLDISEKRLPQDGRFNLQVKDKMIDVRISTLPVQYGESVVMRLLDHSDGLLNLTQLGMPSKLQQRFEHKLKHAYGMLLVTGPTGSGKTTTLYAALNLLNRPETKIISIEDPIEYRLPRVNQVQINSDIGLTFSRVLRSALRQDPDVVLVGEMRDEETAEIGLRAAMTGHLVLSTLHTNDAISVVNRLMDMGAKDYLIAASLRAVIAQRLLRRICGSCRTAYTPNVQQQAWLNSVLNQSLKQAPLQHGIGCAHCHNTGYHGRVGIFELLEIDAQLANLLTQGDVATFTQIAKQRPNYQNLSQAALQLTLRNITSLEEAERISGGLDEFVHLA
jgi:MSHA biogenesis protein MshE